MPEDLNIIWILAVGLGFACAAGYVAQRLKLSPILGYLIAGFLIGPNSPGFIADQNISGQLANIGVTLLMFAVGLNFNWKDIDADKKIVIPGALLLSFLSICAGIGLSRALGQTVIEGFVIGVAICVSSTVVIVRVLADQNLLHTKQGHIVVGWTIIEDLVSVLGLILLPALIYSPSTSSSSPFFTILASVGMVLLKVFLLGLIVHFIGENLIEKILKLIARARSHELFTLAILASVFLIAVGSSYIFGISLALGAFIAGTVVGKTELSHQAAANALPMRDAFAVIFFVSVGMLFNPLVVKNNLPLFGGVLLILLFLRPLVAYFIVKIAKYPSYVGFTVALAISQIGEYSFILAEEGSRLKILPDNAYDILVACAFISIALNPILFQFFKPLTQAAKRAVNVNSSDIHLSGLSEVTGLFLPRVLVVGFGPIGRAVAHHLAANHQVLVIDQNIDTVSSTKEKNIELFFGDATQLQLLERVKIENVQLIVITTPDLPITNSIITAAQHINPHADIIARVHFERDYEHAKFSNIPIVCDETACAEKMVLLLSQRVPSGNI
ncbi:cation:proton antiporter [Parachlamydia sp. AcF125]|uniref:cation:proton antiporter n=1 Tax=Parachlamydia sp. AcF125 TaxID=2795736 RepID=UPI001BC9FFC0|nr:cation:proton antiporter [Parachlamydia sp. AcF125]MBS4169046.1 putative cation/proton antiporter YbaL [Parachlamydia sp. AcF125]